MRSRTGLRWLSSLVVFALVLAACASSEDSGDSGDDGGGEKPATLQTGAGFEGTPDSGTIKLGVLTPASGPFQALGTPLTEGNKLYFDALNANGGVAGKYKVELVEADTQYMGDIARNEYNRIKGDVAAFVQITGTEVTNNVLPLLEEDGYAGGPATLDAEWVVDPNLMPVFAPYQIEVLNGAEYYETTEGFDGKNVCIMAQDDSYGDAGIEGVDFAAGEYGFEVASTQRFATGGEFTAQIQALKDANCDVVFQASTPVDSPNIWGQAIATGFAPRWIGLGPAWASFFKDGDQVDYIKDHVWIVAEDGASLDESFDGVAEMIANRDQYAPDMTFNLFSIFGYGQAWAVDQILERAVENNDITPEGIVKAIGEEETLKFGGITGDYQYGPDRNPPRVNAIFTVGDAETGLETVQLSVEGDPAKAYTF